MLLLALDFIKGFTMNNPKTLKDLDRDELISVCQTLMEQVESYSIEVGVIRQKVDKALREVESLGHIEAATAIRNIFDPDGESLRN